MQSIPRRTVYNILCSLAILFFASYNFRESQEDRINTPRRALREEPKLKPGTKDGRPLNILTLGGSVTWGAGIPLRQHAYPFRLKIDKEYKVTNLAIRGTGSGYPAQCISSLLQGHEKDKRSDYDPTVPFDVIIFEFSLNGFDNFELLLLRLRERYPDALLIYVDIWSLSLREKGFRGAFDSTKAHKLVEDAGGFIYHFHQRGPVLTDFDFKSLTTDELHDPSIVDLFGKDRHHLSYSGHDLVKVKILEILQEQPIPENPRFGSWHGGDNCSIWYESGTPSVRIANGAHINQWDKEKHKWAIEVGAEGAMLEYNNNSDDAAQISLQFMSKSEDMWDKNTSKYPPVIVAVSNSEGEILEARRMAWDGEVSFEMDKISEGSERWTYISGLHRKTQMRQFHVTDSKKVGTLQPGHNYVYVFPTRKTEYPFRITATIVCAACSKLGFQDI